MKRIKFNTTWEEDEEERRKFYASLSYGERLKYLIEGRKRIHFRHNPPSKYFDLRFCDFELPKAPFNPI
jgi:hypothetical protein